MLFITPHHVFSLHQNKLQKVLLLPPNLNNYYPPTLPLLPPFAIRESGVTGFGAVFGGGHFRDISFNISMAACYGMFMPYLGFRVFHQ